MYLPNFHERSDTERRANDRTRFTTLLASVSMLTLGLGIGLGNAPAGAAATQFTAPSGAAAQAIARAAPAAPPAGNRQDAPAGRDAPGEGGAQTQGS